MGITIESDRIVKVSELHNDTSKCVEAAQQGPLFIMRYGSPKAVLIGTGVFEELLDRIQLKRDLTQRKEISTGRIPLEDLQKQHGL